MNNNKGLKYQKKQREKMVVLVSGGRSSAMMAHHISTSELYKSYEKLYLFCNTSLERKETIDFLRKMVEYWGIDIHLVEGVFNLGADVPIASKRVSFDDLKMKGEVFSEMLERQNLKNGHSLPNISAPYCSTWLKQQVANNYAKQWFGTPSYIKALGYRAEDMPKRITYAELKNSPYTIAPLLTDWSKPINQRDLTYWFDKQSFQLNLGSGLGNCALCWKKSFKVLIKNIQHGDANVEWMRQMEIKYNNTMFRERKSINDLVALAESGSQINIFGDIGDECVCSF